MDFQIVVIVFTDERSKGLLKFFGENNSCIAAEDFK